MMFKLNLYVLSVCTQYSGSTYPLLHKLTSSLIPFKPSQGVITKTSVQLIVLMKCPSAYHGNSFQVVGKTAFTLEKRDTTVEEEADHHAEWEDVCYRRHGMMQLSFWSDVVQIRLEVADRFRVKSAEGGFVLK